MTYTLFDLSYLVGREMDMVLEGYATGGSSTTIVDGTYLDQSDDYWKKGSAWIISAGGAAPEGEWARITASSKSNTRVTIEAVSAAVESGDRYAVCRPTVPRDVIIQCINRTLQDIGKIRVEDLSSLTTQLNITEYDLPVAVKDLRQVLIQTNTDTDDWRPRLLYNWKIIKSAAGVADVLRFPYYLESNRKLILVHGAHHTELTAKTDKLDESIPVNMVVSGAAVRGLKWVRNRRDVKDENLNIQIRELAESYNEELARYDRRLPPKTQHITLVKGGVPTSIEYEDKVRLV